MQRVQSGVTGQPGASVVPHVQQPQGAVVPSPAKEEALSPEEEASLGENCLELPFILPDDVEARNWFYEYEAVDVLEGGLDELKALADRAPTPTARSYLLGIITVRSSVEMYGPAA